MPPKYKPKIINPLLFCAVCALWRSIAFSTAQLWKRAFVFVPQGIKKGQAKRKAAYLVRWIEHSGSLPLTLHISCDVDVSLGTGPDAPIVSVLNRYAARWETLYHHSIEDHLWPFRMLRAHSQLLFGFAGWHSLREIRSSHLNGALHEPHQKILWSQLTDLQICAPISTSRAMDILRECPQLVRLSIAVSRSTEVHASPTIQHGLVTLGLTTYSCPLVLQSISLPNLRNLYMSKLSAHFESLLGFLTRSSCSLDKLVISGTNLTQRDHINLLAHKSCKLLSSLTISDPIWPSDFSIGGELVRRLTLHQHNSLCARLKVLTISCWFDIPASALTNMVESRMGSCAGQLPDELLQHLQLWVNVDQAQNLEKVGKRIGVECARHSYHKLLNEFPISLWRRGFRERVPAVLFSGLLLDEM